MEGWILLQDCEVAEQDAFHRYVVWMLGQAGDASVIVCGHLCFVLQELLPGDGLCPGCLDCSFGVASRGEESGHGCCFLVIVFTAATQSTKSEELGKGDTIFHGRGVA